MPPDKNVHLCLPEELADAMEARASAEGKSPDEVYQDAVRRYLGQQKLHELSRFGQEQARKLGLKEEDVPRLIEEVRRDQRERER